MKKLIDGNSSKPHLSKMHNIQETQKTVSKQTKNRMFDTSIFAIFIDFAFEFWYDLLVQAIDTLQRMVSKIYFHNKTHFR